jgi:hypothetical protein
MGSWTATWATLGDVADRAVVARLLQAVGATSGWVAERSSGDALLELLGGLRDGADMNTPPLAADTGGPGRLRELLTGVGRG